MFPLRMSGKPAFLESLYWRCFLPCGLFRGEAGRRTARQPRWLISPRQHRVMWRLLLLLKRTVDSEMKRNLCKLFTVLHVRLCHSFFLPLHGTGSRSDHQRRRTKIILILGAG